jgi:hypothetical protein
VHTWLLHEGAYCVPIKPDKFSIIVQSSIFDSAILKLANGVACKTAASAKHFIWNRADRTFWSQV